MRFSPAAKQFQEKCAAVFGQELRKNKKREGFPHFEEKRKPSRNLLMLAT